MFACLLLNLMTISVLLDKVSWTEIPYFQTICEYTCALSVISESFYESA